MFKGADCVSLIDLFLHFTNVTGDYKSVSKDFCPELKTVYLQGTLVIGNLEFLPGETGRPKPNALQ